MKRLSVVRDKPDRPVSDLEILARIDNPDGLDGAILLLYKQYADTVYAYMLSNHGTKQDAEDIFQEAILVFLELVKNHKYRREASIKTFLVSIARNLWLNELKKRGSTDRREKTYERNRNQEDGDYLELINQRDKQKQLLSLLDQLGDNCKKLILLYYYEDLPMKEIAGHLAYTNEQVVKSKKYKCMQELLRLLRENPALEKQIKMER